MAQFDQTHQASQSPVHSEKRHGVHVHGGSGRCLPPINRGEGRFTENPSRRNRCRTRFSIHGLLRAKGQVVASAQIPSSPLRHWELCVRGQVFQIGIDNETVNDGSDRWAIVANELP